MNGLFTVDLDFESGGFSVIDNQNHTYFINVIFPSGTLADALQLHAVRIQYEVSSVMP